MPPFMYKIQLLPSLIYTVGAIIISFLADFVGLPTYKKTELCIILIIGTF